MRLTYVVVVDVDSDADGRLKREGIAQDVLQGASLNARPVSLAAYEGEASYAFVDAEGQRILLEDAMQTMDESTIALITALSDHVTAPVRASSEFNILESTWMRGGPAAAEDDPTPVVHTAFGAIGTDDDVEGRKEAMAARAEPRRVSRVVVTVEEREVIGDAVDEFGSAVKARRLSEIAQWHVAELDHPADAVTFGQRVRRQAERTARLGLSVRAREVGGL